MNNDFIIENDILIKYTGNKDILKIPENIKKIDIHAFSNNTNIKEIILSKTCEIIEEAAFENCKRLEKINLCNIKEIKQYAFQNCENLKEIELPKTLENLHSIFGNCYKLEKIKLNAKYTEKEIYYLTGVNNPSLKEVTGPNIICENGVIYNEDKTHLIYYLESKKDEYFKIPDEVKILKQGAFNENKYLKTLEFGKNVEEMETITINCEIENIIVNNNLKKINDLCISNACKIKTLDLSKTKIEKIFKDTFVNENCTIKLPINIKYIEISSFCTNKFIINEKSNPTINGDKTKIQIERIKTLEDLLNEGKSFHEASQTMKNYER